MKIVAVIVVVALVATALVVVTGEKKLTATIKGGTLEVDAGSTMTLTVVAKLGKKDVSNESSMKIKWSVTPVNLGSLSYKARPQVPFVAGIEGGNGTVTCTLSYNGKNVTVQKSLRVLPPFLDSISVTPSSKTIVPGGNYTFRAAAISSVGLAISGIDFAWTVSADAGVTYTLNATTGTTVVLTVGTTLGNMTLSASGSYGGKTKTGNSSITVGYLPPRSVDYVWYDLFNVPINSWYYKRWEIYKQEEPISTSYPWIFYYHSSPEGNVYTYSLMRLNITGRNVSDINMNDKPEFLPILSPTERGGTAVIDWYMQYLTKDELDARYGVGIGNQDDGWIIDLNGTVTLDKQAAKTVLNLTDVGWDTFSEWWGSHNVTFNQAYSDWLVSEAEGRVDIENAYESYYQLFAIKIVANKVGDKIQLTYDILTWGMETLMLRWLHECFLPIEMWYEDMNFHMTISPEWSRVDVDTAVTYAAFATESLNHTGKPRGDPTWTFQPLLGDVVPSSLNHPHSDFDKYENLKYTNMQAGGELYGQLMSYDVVPAAWNLTTNETLTFKWPSGNQLFRYHVKPGIAVNISDDSMAVVYSEPMQTDFPGQILMNNSDNTLKFIGPIPMYDWSKTQTAHTYLANEWFRLGGNTLPYGMPTVEFKKKNPVVIYLDHFDIKVTTPIPANDLVTVDVTAIDQYGNTYYDYNGTVNFTSTDSAAIMPANYTFTGADSGVHTFVGAAQFQTTGAQTLSVVNVSTDTPLKRGDKAMTILPARTADSMSVGVYQVPAESVPEDVTVTVFDQYGDLFVNYTGTVTFSTNRSGEVTLPPDYDFVLADAGVHTIAGGLTFTGIYWFAVNASDLSDSSIAGSQTNIWVGPDPEVIDHFSVTGIKSMLLKQKSDVRVTAYDQYGWQFRRYTGTITFSANNSGGLFPADYTFQLSDLGYRVFEKAVSFTVSADTVFNVTVSDTVVTSAIGYQINILIQYKPASETFRMYDMFQQPWGEWWPWRYKGYSTDIILSNETGKYTMIYNADKRGNQGIIYAPYRWNITGTNLSQVSVHSPEFMPVMGTASVPGASASLEVYFEYLSWASWNNYWSPVWHFPNSVMQAQATDGYYPGALYNVTMNRQAAEEWLGMPQTADPLSWWAANGNAYKAAWEAWILNEGNNRLDIWAGYEYPYIDLATAMRLSVLPNGNIYLEIGHLGEGFEILMTRWMNETQICNHEPYYEDLNMAVKYYSDWIDISFDAVCQYSLKAVLANQSLTNEAAWAWEPQLIDYVPTWNTPGGLHPSKFDKWAVDQYQSMNAGDPLFKKLVNYDSGVQYFNLTDYQRFIVELPHGSNNLGYYAEPVPTGTFGAIKRIITGGTAGSGYDKYPSGLGNNYNYSAYWPLMMNGTMSLGYYGNWTGAPDLKTMFNNVTKTLTMVGPMRFDNTYQSNGALYHGAPWLEFNVTPVAGGTSLPATDVVGPGAPVSVTAELMSLAAVIAATSMAVVVLAACARRKV